LEDIVLKVKPFRDQLKVIENGFKQQFVLYLSYKDNADIMDTFENSLNHLLKD
jgi:hypothetical protein